MVRLRDATTQFAGRSLGRWGPVGAQLAARLADDRSPADDEEREEVHDVIRRGLHLRLDPADTVQRHILVTGTYDEPSVHLIEHSLRPGDVVLDVGANIGWFSLRLGRRLRRLGGGSVHAFEPAPDTMALLRHHVAANGLEQVVHTHEVALGDRDGNLVLHSNSDFGGLDVGTRTLFGTGPKIAEVPVRRGAELLEAQGVERVDIVKIDVEGAEWLVLQGLAPFFGGSAPPRLVVIELIDQHLSRSGSSTAEIVEFFTEHGYQGEKISADVFGLRARFRRSPKPLAHNVAFRRPTPAVRSLTPS